MTTKKKKRKSTKKRKLNKKTKINKKPEIGECSESVKIIESENEIDKRYLPNVNRIFWVFCGLLDLKSALDFGFNNLFLWKNNPFAQIQKYIPKTVNGEIQFQLERRVSFN